MEGKWAEADAPLLTPGALFINPERNSVVYRAMSACKGKEKRSLQESQQKESSPWPSPPPQPPSPAHSSPVGNQLQQPGRELTARLIIIVIAIYQSHKMGSRSVRGDGEMADRHRWTQGTGAWGGGTHLAEAPRRALRRPPLARGSGGWLRAQTGRWWAIP